MGNFALLLAAALAVTEVASEFSPARELKGALRDAISPSSATLHDPGPPQPDRPASPRLDLSVSPALAPKRPLMITERHFEYCQTLQYEAALLKTVRDKHRDTTPDSDELSSIGKYSDSLRRKLYYDKKAHTMTDFDIIAEGFSGGNEQLFHDHCWYAPQRTLVPVPDPGFWEYFRGAETLKRRIEDIEAQLVRLGDRRAKMEATPPETASQKWFVKWVEQDERTTSRLTATLPDLQGLKEALLTLESYNMIPIYVRVPSGALFRSVVFPHDTVEDLMIDVQSREGTSPDEQKLVFEGSVLENGRLLHDYGIRDDSVVHLIRRLPRRRLSRTDLYGDGTRPSEADYRVSDMCGPSFLPGEAGCFLPIPYGYGNPGVRGMNAQELLLNFTAGPQPGSVLLNGVPLEGPCSDAPAYVIPADVSYPRVLDTIRAGHYVPSAKITRWTQVAGKPGRDLWTRGEKRGKLEYIVRILEVDNEPVRLPNIMVSADVARADRPFGSITAAWTYYDVEEVQFKVEVFLD